MRSIEAESRVHLLEAAEAMQAGHDEHAITQLIDPVLASYEKLRDPTFPIYCPRGDAERQAYVAEATRSGTNAVVLDCLWASAWYLKAQALVALDRSPEAQKALESAVALAPQNAVYLTELALVHHRRAEYEKALELYIRAERATQVSPPGERNKELAAAMIGQGQIHGEAGDLDEAEARFLRSLEVDPGNAFAKEQLALLRAERAGAKKP